MAHTTWAPREHGGRRSYDGLRRCRSGASEHRGHRPLPHRLPKGTLDDEDEHIQARLTDLKRQTRQLRARQAQLQFELEHPSAAPNQTALAEICHRIRDILRAGGHREKKALFEALIQEIKIQSDDTLIPVFKIPMAEPGNEAPASTGRPGMQGRFAHCHLWWA